MVTQVRAPNKISSRLRNESKKRALALVGSGAPVLGLDGYWYAAPLARWFGTWRCECTDVELSQVEIPERCPTHGQPLIGNRELFDFGESITLGIAAP